MGFFNAIGVAGVVLTFVAAVDGTTRSRRGASPHRKPSVAQVLAAGVFLMMLGFGAALLWSSTGVPRPTAALGGLAIGLAFGCVAYALATAVAREPGQPDGTGSGPTVGSIARVTSAIPGGGLGEVSLVTGDEGLKVPARAEGSITQGTSVVIIDVTDAAVVVAEAGF